MKRYIHKDLTHQYEISQNGWGRYEARELRKDGYGSSLNMDADQLFNFEGMLLKNGWTDILSKKAQRAI